MRRMRDKYNAGGLELSQTDYQALRYWAESSDTDKQIEQDCFRNFIGQSLKRLAQVINVIYPDRVVWSADPVPIINILFPSEEIKGLLQSLARNEILDEAESNGIERIQKLFDGKYPTPLLMKQQPVFRR